MKSRIATLLIGSLGLFTAAAMMAMPAANAAFPGSNGVIAFNGGPGNNSIWTINPDGTGQTRILHNSDSNQAPSYSPDGEHIVFFSNLSGNNDIWMMDSDGTGLKQLTNSPADDIYPAFSPDGNRVVFESNRRNGQYNLFVRNLVTGTTRRLLTGPVHVGKPDWLGNKVAFERTTMVNTNVWTVNVNTGALIQVTHLTGVGISAGHPSFSPDGSHIAFTSNVSGTNNIYMVNSDGGGARVRLTNESSADFQPCFSPDGHFVAFSSDRLFGASNIFYVNVATKAITTVTDQSATDYSNPGWQPVASS